LYLLTSGELITDSKGRKVVVYPVISSSEKYKPKDWKIKSASAEMDCQRAAKLSSLWKIINGDLDNRQTHQTKAPSSTR